jgi:predicted ribosomally synthesized peptide with SipW-like signal peptide
MIGKSLATMLVLALLGGVLAFGSNAVFTDAAGVTDNQFTTGNVDISAGPASAAIALSNMAPGDTVTAPITVTNSGGLAVRYSMTSVTTENVLAAQLDLTIKSGVAACTNAGFGASGSVVYATGDLGSTAGINAIGNATTGHQAGDRYLSSGSEVVDADGTFPAAAGPDAATSEALCFQVSLPLATGNSAQNLTTTATFTFNGEQRRNNP